MRGRLELSLTTFLVFASLVANATAIGRSKRLFEAKPADVVKVPYQASLQVCVKEKLAKNTTEDACLHLCNGYISNANTVVSAGLCFQRRRRFAERELYAVVGTTTLYSEEGSRHKVVMTKTHPADEMELKEFGVAVFTVRPNFKWSKAVQPAEVIGMNVYKNRDCKVSGFGCEDASADCDVVKELRQRPVPLEDFVKCEMVIRRRGFVSRSFYFMCFHTYAICDYDLGDPLACNGGIVGLATNLNSSCRRGQTDVYINLRNHKDFLKGSSADHRSLLPTVVVCTALPFIFRQ